MRMRALKVEDEEGRRRGLLAGMKRRRKRH